MLNKKMMIILGMVLVLSMSFVSSYKLLCLGYGDVYPGPSEKVCEHDVCQVCVDEAATYHVNFNYCKDIAACEILNTSNIDADPPNLTINSPVEGGIYESTSVLFDVESNEPCSLYYLDDPERGRWTRVCSSCRDYSEHRRFDEGLNNLTIKCTDRKGNKAELQRTFRVDSMNPKISKTGPRDGFASGVFEVKFKEDNPEEVWLNFGNPGNFDLKQVNLTECEEDKRYTLCQVYVNLSEYDGENIQYWFNITDVAGNYDESRIDDLKVDYSSPRINSVEVEKDKRKVYFTINISEINFKEIAYIDSEEGKERKLCNKLKDSICEGKGSFKDGKHNLTIIVRDEAGNEANESVDFFIDSKVPKILKSEPRKGFTNGLFSVQFKEENPVLLLFHYGNETSKKQAEVNLSECSEYRGKHSCDIQVDLSEFNGQEISYYFEIEDIVGNTAQGKENEVDVDTVFPKLNNNNSFWEKGTGRYEMYVYFSLNITEENFEIAEYYYNGSGRWKSLCTRLDEGICEDKARFDPGAHTVDIQITDEAGNSIAERIEFGM